jgi:hypothetical protein
MWNISLFNMSIDYLGPVWTPIFVAADRLFTLSLALAPEFIQNWLDATSNGEVLADFESKELLLANVEPLVYLIDRKTKFSTSTENRTSQNNANVIVEPTTSS